MAEENKKVSLRKEAKSSPKTEAREEQKKAKKTWWVQIRMFPIWLRIILVLALLTGAIVLGVMVGYGVIGDGEPSDALKVETWQHIFDIMGGTTD